MLGTFPRSSNVTNDAGDVSRPWDNWLVALWKHVRPGRTTWDAQAAAIASQDLELLIGDAELVRLSWVLRIHQAATTSSVVSVVVVWKVDGVTMTSTIAVEAGNTTTSSQHGTLLIRRDPNTPLRATAAYTSVGATAMTFDLDILTEPL